MARLNTRTTAPKAATGVIKTKTDRPTTTTALGAPAYERKPKSELFILGSSYLAGEVTFHEQVDNRDARFAKLTRHNAESDPQWMVDFVTWLRGTANIRTGSIIAAANAADVMLKAGEVRYVSPVITGALQRADEIGEFWAYWTGTLGRGRGSARPVRRALSYAMARLWDEYSLLKYDTPRSAYRFGDLVDLLHPRPSHIRRYGGRGTRERHHQAALYKYAMDRRRGGEPPAELAMVNEAYRVNRLEPEAKRELLLTDSGRQILKNAGMTWEDIAGFGAMDKVAWEAAIGQMGYMARLRNLRNFDQAGVSDEIAEEVAAYLADPLRVAKSRQLPIRFYAAYKQLASLRWSSALDKALNHSIRNIPQLGGRTLILVDQSPSMYPGYGMRMQRSDMSNGDLAKLFGSAAALRADDATLVQFGSGSEVVPFERGEAALKLMGKFRVIGGTDILGALVANYRRHDRVLIITDEQTQYSYTHRTVDDIVPKHIPVHLWNVGGYRSALMPSGPNRYHLGGLNDACFTLIELLERGEAGRWPWEQ